MSWQPKLRPKGFPHSIDDFAVASLSELEHRSRMGDDKRDQRVFRVKRKHVLKACDRCRVKKTKCDGKQPCNRCSVYNHPCLFRERKATQTKVYSRGFVEMLESHHSLVVKALQKLYKFCITNEGFPGDPLEEAPDGHPLTHAILDRLGLIKQAEENADEPDEDSEDLRYLRLLSTSTECSATAEPSPEPATPPEPSSTRMISRICSGPVRGNPVGPGNGAAPGWGWDMQGHGVQGAPYPSPYDYHLGMQRVSGVPVSEMGEIAPNVVDVGLGQGHGHGHHQSHSHSHSHGQHQQQHQRTEVCYLEPEQVDVKPVIGRMGSIMEHHHMGVQVDGDIMNEFQFHGESFYPGFAPNWSFPSG
ncbi:hypothetical protein N7478_003892 [Penicillium angulare]|uniref:uncharacterized protein n=1 Tax=Penicillium angulare TaxID=116970 RepID=UPI0025423A78|nr:uncharacterized protein N7478_003892 [Penicillium angulare]KAJ5288206.1 hypothetical protein N7478_003892 [Penicillium angulare]